MPCSTCSIGRPVITGVQYLLSYVMCLIHLITFYKVRLSKAGPLMYSHGECYVDVFVFVFPLIVCREIYTNYLLKIFKKNGCCRTPL